MQLIDSDLLSMQEARIIAENARQAQEILKTWSQDALDGIIENVVTALRSKLHEYAKLEYEESGFGNIEDKIQKLTFIIDKLPSELSKMKCVGLIADDTEKKLLHIGVPKGAILTLVPMYNPVVTVINQVLIAIKSGNALVCCPHPRTYEVTKKILTDIQGVAFEQGYPEGAIGFLRHLAQAGVKELMCHEGIDLVINSAVKEYMPLMKQLNKPLLYGGMGNNPVFVEKSADLPKAAQDIVNSKCFDYGTMPGAEQSIVVDIHADKGFKLALCAEGAYFLSQTEANQLIKALFYTDGTMNYEMVGKSAEELAKRAGFTVPKGTRLLIAEERYVSKRSFYTKEIYAPILTYYVEADWMNACEKCIELLLGEGEGHTLAIHSKNEAVIKEFALKKPVGRMLINTPSSFGAVGMSSNLFPSFMLGGGSSKNGGETVDNISPMNLIYVRQAAYGIGESFEIRRDTGEGPPEFHLDEQKIAVLYERLKKIIDSR